MRLLVITNRYPMDDSDDASPFVRDFCVALRAEGCDLRVLTPHYPHKGPVRDPWLSRFAWVRSDRVLGQLSLFNPADLYKAAVAVVAGKKAALALARQFSPDFTLALWALPSGYWALQVALRLGVPYGVWCLGSDIQVWGRRPILKGFVRRVLRHAKLRYADGFALAAETALLGPGTCAFLPTMRRLPESRDQEMPHPEAGRRYFLFLGRLSPEKGVLDLLDAAARLDAATEFGIVFAGIPDGRVNVEGEIAQRRLERICHYAGHLEGRELLSWLCHAEAVVLPSHRDSIPLVLGEAVQVGTPVLCSDLPDFTAVLARYRVGATFPARRPDLLARALVHYLPPDNYAAERIRFLADFSPEGAARRVLADVRGTLGKQEASSVAAQAEVPAYG